jgi:hypothetical protein
MYLESIVNDQPKKYALCFEIRALVSYHNLAFYLFFG